MKPHAFVAMPFGSKPAADGSLIHFDRIYAELLKPALQDAGCEVFRADEEPRAGDIRADMFQELLVADLVVADLTLDNPNVWYELGVRHALRARGVVLVCGPRQNGPFPFDVYTDRKRRYNLRDGAPDPEQLSADRTRIAAMARETLSASTRRRVSPVYALLPHLEQPEWRRLLLSEQNEFGDAYAEWRNRLEVARQKNRAGDILLLAGETPTRALQLEARREAGNALLRLQQPGLALEQFEAALTLEVDDPVSRAKRVVCLGRTGKLEDAAVEAQRLTQRADADAETWALAGRVAKDIWISRWRLTDLDSGALREAAAAELASLEQAGDLYGRGFVLDPSHHYSGINALVLMVLQQHLGGEIDVAHCDRQAGGVRWAAQAAAQRNPGDYWALATLADLALLLGNPDQVQHEFRRAVAAANHDWFALDSTRQTALLLQQLGYRSAESAVALEVLDREIRRLKPPRPPRQVLLFSGHMVDAPDRARPRFPASQVDAAAAAIAEVLDRLQAGPEDVALTQGAAGGDLLFAEACLQRGVRLSLMLPMAEPDFIDNSILPSVDGEKWRSRWYALQSQLAEPPRIAPEELGPAPKGCNEYERCNRWLMATALAQGPEKVRFICLWDGGGSDGPGGTRHMHDEVKRRTGRVDWIDTRTLGSTASNPTDATRCNTP